LTLQSPKEASIVEETNSDLPLFDDLPTHRPAPALDLPAVQNGGIDLVGENPETFLYLLVFSALFMY
jgi:hypothetical protein